MSIRIIRRAGQGATKRGPTLWARGSGPSREQRRPQAPRAPFPKTKGERRYPQSMAEVSVWEETLPLTRDALSGNLVLDIRNKGVHVSEVVRFSEASALAMHAMAMLVRAHGRWIPLRELAGQLRVSQSHLAKVLQRLSRAGLVMSSRGPGGGFRLALDGSEIALLDVYEAMEGRYRVRACMFDRSRCMGACIVGDLLERANCMIRDHLAQTRLSELSAEFGRSYEAQHRSDRRGEV